MMERLHNRCLVLSLALLLIPFSGCGKPDEETSAPQPSVQRSERAAGHGAEKPAGKSQKRLPPSKLMAPDLTPDLARIPVVNADETTPPAVRPVASGSQAPIYRLPGDATDNEPQPDDNAGLTIEVSDVIRHIVRLPDASQNVQPTNAPKLDAPAKADAELQHADTPQIVEATPVQEEERSRWTTRREHSSRTELVDVAATSPTQTLAPRHPPIDKVVEKVRRLPAVVEEPKPAASLTWPREEELPATPVLPETPDFPSDSELILDDGAQGVDREVTFQTVEESPQPLPNPMRPVNEGAMGKIRHAFSLAQRNANYSARIELIDALRSIAEALDLRDGDRRHTNALKRGFRALEEAEDFHQRGLSEELDMKVLVAAHRTPVLKESDLTQITPLVGLQKYLTYAQQQLAIAGGEQPTASLALYGLGRLQVDLSSEEKNAQPQAIVFHQAALQVDSMNYKAANELGVLLAKYGQYTQARDMLAHSVQVCPRPESWQNLAKIHSHLGEADLARGAMHQSQLAARTGANRSGDVRWVDPATLAGTIETSEPIRRATAAPEVESTSPTRNASQAESDGLMRLIPWMRRSE